MPNYEVTVGAGTTPWNASTRSILAPSASSPPDYATDVVVQMEKGGSGIGYVMYRIRPIGRIPSKATAGDVTNQLAAATTDNPGSAWSHKSEYIDLRELWVDGANDGDKIIVSFEPKI